MGLTNLFIFCYFGRLATDSFEKMSNCLYECNWLELKANHQKYFVVMIANAQIPMYYHGFEVAVLNLETFTTLINSIYSYYMMFKTVAFK